MIIGDLDIEDPFFDSLRNDYPDFNKWLKKKSQNQAYVFFDENFNIQGLLYLKVEDHNELYTDIIPILPPKKRLKIGTFKVTYPGQKLGEKFLKIVFDYAIHEKVEEIYVTIHNNNKQKLINLLTYFGFTYWGIKNTEFVYVRDLSKSFNQNSPAKTFPFFNQRANTFIIPIDSKIHKELFEYPIVTTGDIKNIESKRHRNSIRKCYISNSSICKNIQSGDNLLFSTLTSKSIVFTIATVENIVMKIPSLSEFIQYCNGKCLLTESELTNFRNKNNEVYIIQFLYHLTLSPEEIHKDLLKLGNILSEITPCSKEQFNLFIKQCKINESYIVN